MFTWFLSTEGGGTAGQGGARDTAEYKKIQKRNLQLQEENNYLNYKIEVLLDMVSMHFLTLVVLQSNWYMIVSRP